MIINGCLIWFISNQKDIIFMKNKVEDAAILVYNVMFLKKIEK